MAATKPQFSPQYTEDFDAHDAYVRKNVHKTRSIDSVRLGLTVLSLLIGITIVGTAADALAVFNQSHIAEDYLLPLWPTNLHLGPSIAIVAGGSIVVLTSALSLIGSKISALRSNSIIRMILTILAPAAALIGAIVATSFFYAINASTTVDTLQSWSCRWSSVSMSNEPHFSTVCKQSKTALYMTVIMIPLQVIVLGLAVMTIVSEKKTIAAAEIEVEERKASPALS